MTIRYCGKCPAFMSLEIEIGEEKYIGKGVCMYYPPTIQKAAIITKDCEWCFMGQSLPDLKADQPSQSKQPCQTVEQRVINWLANGETGLSSKAIAFHLLSARGVKIDNLENHFHHPFDGADFRRCLLLLKVVPEFQTDLKKMAIVSWQWAKIVLHGLELDGMLKSEIGDDLEDGRNEPSPKTNALMKEILKSEG